MRIHPVIGIALVLLLAALSAPLAGGQQNGDLIETVFYGTVYDNETKEPLEGALVYGFDDSFLVSSFNETDTNGDYRLEFKIGGDFHLFADARGYVQGYSEETIEIDDEKEVDFYLDPEEEEEGESLVFGTVTDQATEEPLEEVAVYIYNVVITGTSVSWELVDYMFTDEDGYYSSGLPPGNYTINAWIEGYESHEGEVFFLEPDVEYQYDIEMERWNNGVFGTVTNEDGDVMEGVVVTIESDWFRGTDTTDAGGNYEIRVPYEDEYTLYCHEEGYRPYREDVVLDGDMEEIDILLTESFLPDPILQLIYLILSLIT